MPEYGTGPYTVSVKFQEDRACSARGAIIAERGLVPKSVCDWEPAKRLKLD